MPEVPSPSVPVLSPIEARVLAALFEKSVATPEYYPLTLNALVAACNQKSNRDPVLQLHESEVSTALEGLRDKQLAWTVDLVGSRVPKYRHRLAETTALPLPALALLCELILRGPQTAAELRAHASRMTPFDDVAQVQSFLELLSNVQPLPLVARLGRQPGRREERFTHQVCGPIPTEPAVLSPSPALPTPQTSDRERIDRLEAEVRALADEVARLKAERHPQ